MSILAAILGSVASTAIGALGSSLSQSKANSTNLQVARETNATNERLAEKNNQFNREMWELNNDYNSPASQIARFKEAGLNPALVYGSSASAGNSSSPVSGTPSRAVMPAPIQRVTTLVEGLAQGMSNILDVASKFRSLQKQGYDNTIASVNANYADGLASANLFNRQTTNNYLSDYLRSRNDVAANNVFKSMYDSWLAKANYIDKNDWVNNWMHKSREQRYRETAARIGLIGKQAQTYDDKHRLFEIQEPMFEAEALKLKNDFEFYDSDLYRGIDKGMNVLGQLIDAIAGGVGIGGKIRGLFGKGRIRSVNSFGDKGEQHTFYNYE